MRERLVYVGRRDPLAEVVRPDVAQLADGLRVGFEPGREVTVLDEPLDQALQGPGAGGLADPPHEHVPDYILQHFAGPDQCHLRVHHGTVDGLADTLPQFLELLGELVQAVGEVLERRVHQIAQLLDTEFMGRQPTLGRRLFGDFGSFP